MDMGLKNKTALVTGSTKGIGKAIAIELAKEGVHVLINGRNEEEAERTVNEIKSAFPATSPQTPRLTSWILGKGKLYLKNTLKSIF